MCFYDKTIERSYSSKSVPMNQRNSFFSLFLNGILLADDITATPIVPASLLVVLSQLMVKVFDLTLLWSGVRIARQTVAICSIVKQPELFSLSLSLSPLLSRSLFRFHFVTPMDDSLLVSHNSLQPNSCLGSAQLLLLRH